MLAVPPRYCCDPITGETPVTYGYDGQGRETRIERSGAAAGRVADHDRVRRAGPPRERDAGRARGVVWLYDIAGRPTRQTWPGGAFYVTYTHTAAGQLTEIRENGTTLLATYAYDSFGRLIDLARGNGRSTSYAFDPVSRLSRINHHALVYTDFTYNPASQILTRRLSNGDWAWAEGVNYNRAYARNVLNQYTVVGGVTHSYDLNGNLTDNGPDSFDYDPENRLKRATVGSTVVNLRYDGRGRLRRRWDGSGTVDYVYAGDALIAEYSGTTVLRRYVHGAGVDEPLVWYEGSGTTDRRYLLADERGSIATVTSNTGAILARNTYDEWGVPAATNLGRFQYTGQQWLPEIGLYYYKARFYNPAIGRFMQTDPIGYEDGMNLYAYVGNDPTNLADPSGMLRCAPPSCGKDSPLQGIEGFSDFSILAGIVTIQSQSASTPPSALGAHPLLMSLGADENDSIIVRARHAVDEGRDRMVESLRQAQRAAWGLARRQFDLTGERVMWIHDQIVSPACCFIAGTLVATPEGLVPIESLETGHLVISRDDRTGETAAKPITQIIPAHERRLWSVMVSYQDEEGRWKDEAYQTTTDHPWRTSDGQWIVSASLTEGMVLARERGTAVVVSSSDTGRVELTYNLEIADFHTYFVGEAGVWVHNACSPAESPIWRGLRRWRGSTRTDGSHYFQWDYTHSNIEIYNRRGDHIGVMDPYSGEVDVSAAVRGRTINVR